MTVRLLTALFSLGAPLLADDLEPLSDEFDSAASLGSWQRLNDVEGWDADQLETWDIDTSTVGHMRLAPYSSGWFANMRGVLVFKEVSGDFIITLRTTVSSRTNPDGPAARPVQMFSLTGIFVHGPRGITSAAPTPYTTDPVFPPGDFGSDWQPNTDNYIFLSYGRGGDFGPNPNDGVRHQYEVKVTRNGSSNLYFAQSGVPAADVPDYNTVTLQMVRVGGTAAVLRKHAGGDWIVENRYPNETQNFPAWGDDVQAGVTAYTDWDNISRFNSAGDPGAFYHNYRVFDGPESYQGQSFTPVPDLISDVDFIRYQRPDPALTEAMLQALPRARDPFTNVSNAADGALPGDGAGAFIGDNANRPLGAYRSAAFGAAMDLPEAGLAEDFDADGKATLVEYAMGTPPEIADAEGVRIGGEGDGYALTFPCDPGATAAMVVLEAAESLATGWESVAHRAAGSRDWTAADEATVVVVDGAEVTVVPAAGSAHRFFRLRAIIP